LYRARKRKGGGMRDDSWKGRGTRRSPEQVSAVGG